jgi:hypothetical protein
MLVRKPLTLWIACGNRERMDEWAAFVVAEGSLERALGPVDPAQEIGRVSKVLPEIMRSALGLRSISSMRLADCARD